MQESDFDKEGKMKLVHNIINTPNKANKSSIYPRGIEKDQQITKRSSYNCKCKFDKEIDNLMNEITILEGEMRVMRNIINPHVESKQ